MSFFKKIFPAKKDKGSSKQDEALKKIGAAEEMLLKKQEHLEKKVEEEKDIARKNRASNKRVSLEALKRKKRYDRQLSEIDSSLSQIEMQREALEGVETNTSILLTMKTAADAIKVANKHMDIDQVQDAMEDITDTQNMAHEVTDIINNSMAFGHNFDEKELERELECLQEEELGKIFSPVTEPNNGLNFPEVPTGDLFLSEASSSSKKQNEDEEEKFYDACL